MAVLSSTRALLEATRRQTLLAYADDDWSPIPDVTLDIVASRLGAVLAQDALPPAVQELGLPAYFGAPVIVVNRELGPGMRRLALRHGLAHLVAGELEPESGADVRFMSSVQDFASLEERRADLFAIADLIPDRQLTQLRSAGADADGLVYLVALEISKYADSWPLERVLDRARLRVQLEASPFPQNPRPEEG